MESKELVHLLGHVGADHTGLSGDFWRCVRLEGKLVGEEDAMKEDPGCAVEYTASARYSSDLLE